MARAAAEKKDRRSEIARALYRCMRRRGFANTTLRDIADTAGMTPSHVGYYFDNKGAILEYYGERICTQNLAGLPALDEVDPRQLLASLASFCLGEGRSTPGMQGVIQELNGLAVHDDRLRAIKASHTKAWRTYLEHLFAGTGTRAGIGPREAAFAAHAVLSGLYTNGVFDADLDRETARRIFLSALQDLSGLANEPAPGRRGRTRARGPAAAGSGESAGRAGRRTRRSKR